MTVLPDKLCRSVCTVRDRPLLAVSWEPILIPLPFSFPLYRLYTHPPWHKYPPTPVHCPLQEPLALHPSMKSLYSLFQYVRHMVTVSHVVYSQSVLRKPPDTQNDCGFMHNDFFSHYLCENFWVLIEATVQLVVFWDDTLLSWQTYCLQVNSALKMVVVACSHKKISICLQIVYCTHNPNDNYLLQFVVVRTMMMTVMTTTTTTTTCVIVIVFIIVVVVWWILFIQGVSCQSICSHFICEIWRDLNVVACQDGVVSLAACLCVLWRKEYMYVCHWNIQKPKIKNWCKWYITIQFLPHREHTRSLLQRLTS